VEVSSNWNFDVQWSPCLPAVISTCSLEGKVCPIYHHFQNIDNQNFLKRSLILFQILLTLFFVVHHFRFISMGYKILILSPKRLKQMRPTFSLKHLNNNNNKEICTNYPSLVPLCGSLYESLHYVFDFIVFLKFDVMNSLVYSGHVVFPLRLVVDSFDGQNVIHLKNQLFKYCLIFFISFNLFVSYNPISVYQ
jgi:hypothetical protein